MAPVVNRHWRAGCILFCFYTHFEEWSGGTILLVVLEKRPHFIDNLREEALFFVLNCEVDGIFLIYVQGYAGGWLEFHFMDHALPGTSMSMHQDRISLAWMLG